MQQQEFKEPHYISRGPYSRIISLRKKNREKVSLVCDLSSRNSSLKAISRNESKLKLKKQLSKSINMHKKHITQPQIIPHKISHFTNSNQQEKQLHTPIKYNHLNYVKLENNQPLPSIIHNPPKHINNYKSILNKLIQKPSPLKNYQPDDKLIISVQRSDNTSKSKSKSKKKIPRVIDVFQLYDRKKLIRNSRLANRNILDKQKLAQQGSLSGSKMQHDSILQSPVLTVQDFDTDSLLKNRIGRQKQSKPTNLTLSKELAKISNSMHKFEGVIIRGATSIPQLPLGKTLVFKIYENWGDSQYIGLNGVQFFNQKGDRVTPHHVYSDPGSSTSSMQYEHRVENLINGIPYHTSTSHSFLMPISQACVNSVVFVFNQHVRFSMIRVWNYNCSALESRCGAKTVEIKLDGAYIFIGGLKKAEGRMRQYWKTCEYIILTQQSSILDRIQRNDWLNKMDFSRIDSTIEDEMQTLNISDGFRLNKGNNTVELEIFENYGHLDTFRFAKLSLFDSIGEEIRFRIREGRAKEYPLIARSIHLHILESKTVHHIIIKNSSDSKALKRIRLIIDGNKVYEVNLRRTKEDQNIYISTNIFYGPAIIQQDLIWIKSVNVVMTPLSGSRYIGINKIEMYDVLGMPILRSRQLRLSSSIPLSFNNGQLQPNKEDWAAGEARLQIKIEFEEIVPLAVVCFFNYRKDSQKAAKTVHLFSNNKTLWSGYIATNRQSQPLTALFLSSCPALQQKLGPYTVDQQKFYEQISHINEGKPIINNFRS